MQPEQPAAPQPQQPTQQPPVAAQPTPTAEPQPVQPAEPVAPAPTPEPAPVVTDEFQADEDELSSDDMADESAIDNSDDPIQWQAPEYVQERRSPWWFIAFWAVTLIIMALAAFVVQSISFAILVPVMAAALMMYSHRPPREITYVLSNKGVYINEKLHPLAEFRSFGVGSEETLPSLVFIPTKRFRPALTIHFPVEFGEEIVDMLGARIPMQELRFDVFDRLIQKLHL